MCISYSEARKAWDVELNRIYQALGGSKNTVLRDAQRAWIDNELRIDQVMPIGPFSGYTRSQASAGIQ